MQSHVLKLIHGLTEKSPLISADSTAREQPYSLFWMALLSVRNDPFKPLPLLDEGASDPLQCVPSRRLLRFLSDFVAWRLDWKELLHSDGRMRISIASRTRRIFPVQSGSSVQPLSIFWGGASWLFSHSIVFRVTVDQFSGQRPKSLHCGSALQTKGDKTKAESFPSEWNSLTFEWTEKACYRLSPGNTARLKDIHSKDFGVRQSSNCSTTTSWREWRSGTRKIR
jgi:hypothetical protein